MKAIVIDTETNQLENPEVVQVAYLPFKLYQTTRPYKTIKPQPAGFSKFFKPSTPITAGAMAVHMITNYEVRNRPASDTFKLPEETKYLIGHNIDFDVRALGSSKHKLICTLAMCRSFFPEWGSHTLGASLIELYGEKNGLRILGQAHHAANDAKSCAYLLHALIDHIDKPVTSFEQLHLISEKCRIPKVMTFGKHKGEPVSEVPHTYRSWYKSLGNKPGEEKPDPYLLKAWGL